MSGRQTRKAWDRQWRGKILSTCAQHLDQKGAEAIGAGWARFFGRLSKGARVLDIGTGNGIVPLIALQVSDAASMGFEVFGADYAAIDPASALPEQAELLGRVSFHPETPTENLPFEDAFFDALTAQHAFEYGDMEKSAAEVARVLKPGGKMRFLMHAREGEIVHANLCKIAQSRYILEEAKLFDGVRQAAKTGQGEDLKTALEETSRKFENDPNTRDLHELLELLWGAYEARDKFESDQVFSHWLSENEAELSAQMHRIEALEKAALDEKAAKAVEARFRKLGMKTRLEAQMSPGGPKLGWLLQASKN